MSIWNRFPNGLTAVKADRLELGEIFDATWKKRTWVTTGARGYVDFRIENKPEGSEIITEKRQIPYRVVVALPGASNTYIRTYDGKNWSDVEIPTVGSLPVNLWDYKSVINLEKGKYVFYVRVMGDGFPVAWSSPIWVDIK